MITKEELLNLLDSTETYRVEKTISTTNMDKFCEAICAFANDMPNSKKNGYLLIGVNDDGSRCGLKATDELLLKLSAIRTDGNILPLPVMNVDTIPFDDGEVLVIEVTPSVLPPVRYRGRTYIRISARKGIATREEEDILVERRSVNFPTFDTTPCPEATIDDIDTELITRTYLPRAINPEVLAQDTRSLKEQLAALRLYDLKTDHPTNAAIILFGKRPEYFLLGNYIQFVRFKGVSNAADVINQFEFKGSLASILPKLDTFIETSVIQNRPVPVSVLKEENKYNYPLWAIRELMMNAVMHRDYKTHTPTKLYQYSDHLEITNAGGLYGNARPENFPNVNDYRNPIVAEALKTMGYVNMFNRGVARVQSLLEENGNGHATFVIDRITTFGVNIKNASLNDAIEVVPEVDATPKTTLKTTLKTTAKIIEVIENNPSITRQEIAEALDITLDGVKWQLNKLKKEGTIKREGSSRNGKWVVIRK